VRAALNRLVPGLGRLIARDRAAYSYLPASMDRFLTPGELCTLLAGMDLADIFVQRQSLGIAHLVGARRPL
jgi:demethylmenaquinone methyltransferase/2-methoxy-6-polyprenyl-1,4-benzoquinol methylase